MDNLKNELFRVIFNGFLTTIRVSKVDNVNFFVPYFRTFAPWGTGRHIAPLTLPEPSTLGLTSAKVLGEMVNAAWTVKIAFDR